MATANLPQTPSIQVTKKKAPRSAKKNTAPAQVEAEKVAATAQKLAKDNSWCSNGRSQIAVELKRIGVDFDATTVDALQLLVKVDVPNSARNDTYLRSMATAKGVAEAISAALASAFPNGFEVTVPTTGPQAVNQRDTTITVYPQVRVMERVVDFENAAYVS